MICIDSVVGLIDHQQRGTGAPDLAAQVGADHLCVFILDPELNRFLPGPGFPQRIPEGLEWKRFLATVRQDGRAQGNLISPFTNKRSAVTASMVGIGAVAVLFGEQTQADAHDLLSPFLMILSALMRQEVETALARIQVSMAHTTAAEARQLSQSLSKAHDKIASILQAREALTDRLRKEEEKLHLAHQIAGIGVWEFDPLSARMRCSPEAIQMFGLSSAAADGPIETLLIRIHEEDRDSARRAFQSLRMGASDFDLKFRVITSEGSVRWIENRGTLLHNPDGKTSTFLWLSLDITERVLTEQSLIRSERLVVAGRLSASIAHEINNPLEALTNLVYLAREARSIDEVMPLLSVAEEQLKRVSMVAKQSLRFYRDLSAPVRFSVVKIVCDVLDLMRPKFSERQMDVKTEFETGRPDIRGWPGEVMQVITNLLLNAADASPKGSLIRIRVYHRKHKVLLVIADKGAGIAREHAHRVFEPFFSTKAEGGTGLGLWITQQIVGKHGGYVRMRSSATPGRSGTTFRIALPDAESEWPQTITAGYRWLQMNKSHMGPRESPTRSNMHVGGFRGVDHPLKAGAKT